jgi:hypothetical protein
VGLDDDGFGLADRPLTAFQDGELATLRVELDKVGHDVAIEDRSMKLPT